MSKELIERLRSDWRKPENKPPEMLEAADRIEQLEAEVDHLERTKAEWRNTAYQLDVQLAAIQLREQQLREALSSAEYALDECRDYPLTYSDVIEALTLPHDTTALESLIAKAGEVMREKCIPISFKQFLSDVHTAAGLLRYGKKDQGLADRLGNGVINYMTQTVPTVTLEDLK